MRNPPDGNWTFVQALSQYAVCRCSRNSSRMCSFFTSFCGLPAGFGAHVPHFGHESTFGVVLTSGRSLCSTFPHESAEPSVKLCFGQVSTPHTSLSELCISVGVFPRNVSFLMYARLSSLVRVPETRTAAISTLSFPRAHLRGQNTLH